MDALRKAELQKQQGAASEGPPTARSGNGDAGSLSLEPLLEQGSVTQVAADSALPQADRNRRLPELPKRLEELDDQFFTSDPAVQKSIRALAETQTRGTESTAPAGKGIPLPSREAAQNVFAAKQPAAAVGNGFTIVVGTATLIAVAVIGGYFYWQMQPKGGLTTNPALSSMPAAAPSTQTPIPVAAVTPSSTRMAAGEPAKSVTSAPPAGMTPSPQEVNGTTKPETTATKPPRRERDAALAMRPAAAQAVNPADADIHFSTKAKKTDSSMETAHAAFTRGDNEQARSIWMKALQNDSRNINALHGLAALALQEGRPEQASLLYRRVLEVDPRDAVAYAGLVSINVPRDVRQTESQLKRLLSEQPDSPHLNFSLGNLYLAESRWSEAQQAFFKAHVAAPANPDFLYNLAVSLDHLHQDRLAAQYYTRALAAAQTQSASFDSVRVEDRIKMLQAEPK